MGSVHFRLLLLLAALALAWTMAVPHTAFAGGDDDDTSADDDDTSADDDDTSADDDDSSDQSTGDTAEVPFENRELGGGCACQLDGDAQPGAEVGLLFMLGWLWSRRRGAFAS